MQGVEDLLDFLFFSIFVLTIVSQFFEMHLH